MKTDHIITSFVGQLVHKNVHDAIVKLFEEKGLPVTAPWPEGTTITADERDEKYVSYTARGPGFVSTVLAHLDTPPAFVQEHQTLRYFCYIQEDGTVRATENRYGSDDYPKHELGRLPHPVTKFFKS